VLTARWDISGIKKYEKLELRTINEKKETIMHNIHKSIEINENIAIFLTLVEKSREKKQIRDHLINLTMVYKFETDDCEILFDRFDGGVSSITKLKNNDLGVGNSLKPRMNKRQAKKIKMGTKYFMGRIREAQKDRKIEAIILKHNFMRGVTDIFLAHNLNEPPITN